LARLSRRALGLKPAPEFDAWLKRMEIFLEDDQFTLNHRVSGSFRHSLDRLNGSS